MLYCRCFVMLCSLQIYFGFSSSYMDWCFTGVGWCWPSVEYSSICRSNVVIFALIVGISCLYSCLVFIAHFGLSFRSDCNVVVWLLSFLFIEFTIRWCMLGPGSQFVSCLPPASFSMLLALSKLLLSSIWGALLLILLLRLYKRSYMMWQIVRFPHSARPWRMLRSSCRGLLWWLLSRWYSLLACALC